ncbi:TIR domain-containing protein [Puteibacter caeruleilacunae]|nr:TIR domain-containing protein [Puteibacter caeruleilacunae]
MVAYNRRFIEESSILSRKRLDIPCVFLSHQKKDAEYTRKIADFLIENEIDIYFDEYDIDLKNTNQNNNPDKMTKAILKGINSSSHMLVIVSPNTLYSNWVPFEIGFGFDKTDLGILTLKGIAKGKLPAYLKTAKRIRDRYDINSFVRYLTRNNDNELCKSFDYYDHSSFNHPLYNVMDSIIVD